MPVSFTQVSRVESNVTGSVSGSISNMAANSLMVCAVAGFGAPSPATNHQVSDSENAGAYTILGARVTGSSLSAVSLHYMGNSVAGAASSGNASAGAGASGVVGIFFEIAAASTTTPFVTGEFSGSTGTSSLYDPGAVTNSVADAIYVAAFACDQAANPMGHSINAAGTVGTFTENSSGLELNNNSFPGIGTVYQVVASSGTSRKHVWSNGAASTTFASVLAVFSGVGGGGGAARLSPRRGLMGVGF